MGIYSWNILLLPPQNPQDWLGHPLGFWYQSLDRQFFGI